MPTVFLCIGSNQGNRLNALAVAYKVLSDVTGTVTDFSSVYESEPWGFKAETYFLNQILVVETNQEPLELISLILATETGMGRERKSAGYQSREIDIDILLYSDLVIDAGNLQIPHPRMHLRRFVLEPLAELAPGMIHPLMKKSIQELLKQCSDIGRVERVYDKMAVRRLFGIDG